MGRGKVEKCPKVLAKILGYTDRKILKRLTSHLFCRTAATLLADTGLNMVELKRAGRWNAETEVAEYIDDSKQVRRQRELNINNTSETTLKRISTYETDSEDSNSDDDQDLTPQRVAKKNVKKQDVAPSANGSGNPAVVQIVLNMQNGKIV